jgi:hypothetical protein
MADGVEPQGTEQSFSPQIRRARIQIVDIYEVFESELEFLEKGSPDSIYLNFAIFLLSVALSLTVALLTTTTVSLVVFVIFIVCTIVGYVGGALLLILWRRSRNSVSDCIRTIRKRLLSEGTASSLLNTEENKEARA